MYSNLSTPEVSQSYRLIIDIELYQYIMTLAQESTPNEIIGMGAIVKEYHKHYTDFILTDVIVPEQYVSPGYCAFKEGAQNKIIRDVIEGGGNPEELCFRWHSHANGPVFFSLLDEEDIANCDSPYVVNMIINAKHEMIARLDVFEPVHFRNIPVSIIIKPIPYEGLIVECQENIKSCCETITRKDGPKGRITRIMPNGRKERS